MTVFLACGLLPDSSMDADERAIYYYLKSQGRVYVPAREISRRVGGKRRFQHSPEWAGLVLDRMAHRGIVESGEPGRYRIKPIPKKDTRGKVWVTADIAEALKKTGKWRDKLLISENEDEYYERL